MIIKPASAAIIFVACHGGPADHFAKYTEKLNQDSISVQIFAANGPALAKFQSRNISVYHSFTLENKTDESELAYAIAKACSTAKVVITDVGHTFSETVQTALQKQGIQHLVLYENPERFVPVYSLTASNVMLASQGVLFANFNLVEGPIYRTPQEEGVLTNRMGIGYYPLEQVEAIKAQRKDSSGLREQLLENGKDKKICLYFGGNNEEYFTLAFPAFLSMLAQSIEKTDLSNLAIVLHQHPGAKAANIDKMKFEDWQKTHGDNKNCPKLIVSTLKDSNEAQVVADVAMYYQTSISPQFALVGIPTMQVGHQTYSDILIENGLAPSATNSVEFSSELIKLAEEKREPASKDLIYKALGIRENWYSNLRKALKI